MRPEKRLMARAEKAAKSRGHYLGDWRMSGEPGCWFSKCRCGREVIIRTSPRPNETDISGDAIAVNCITLAIES